MHVKQSAKTVAGTAAIALAASSVGACPTNHLLLGSPATIALEHCSAAACAIPKTAGPRAGWGLLGGAAVGGRGEPALFHISIVDLTFIPNNPIIKPNTTVRWTNNDFFIHTTERAATWDSGFLSPGAFFDFDFTASHAGLAFDYICSLHFGMQGTVRVTRFGDANLDGLVNLSDFNVLAANFGENGREWETGDFTGDGLVNLADFNLLAANFGQGIQPAGVFDLGALVPEPGTAALLAPIAALALNRRRRPRGS